MKNSEIHRLTEDKYKAYLRGLDTKELIRKLPRYYHFQERIEYSFHRQSKQLPFIVYELEDRGYLVVGNKLADKRKQYSA